MVIYYKKDVPIKPIIEHLREREASIIRGQVEKLKGEQMLITLNGDVVSIEQLADQRGVAAGAIRIALQDFTPEGYVRVSDRFFISRTKLDELAEKLQGVGMLADALKIIESSGVSEEGGKVLEALGYISIWEGMD